MSSYLGMIESVTVACNDRINKSSKLFLECYDIKHFWCNKITDSGLLTTISNHAMWSEFFAHEKLYLNYPLLRHPSCIYEGVKVLNDYQDPSSAPMAEVIKLGREKYGMQAWVSIMSKVEDGMEEFGFSVGRANISQIISDLPLICQFPRWFKEENRNLFFKVQDNAVDLVNLIGPLFHQKFFKESDHQLARQKFLKGMGIHLESPLSKREVEVVKLLINGYSAFQIGKLLCLSKRTVEHHIERIKAKLMSQTRAELFQKTKELELCKLLNR